MPESRSVGPIDLVLPPDPRLSRVVRLAASGIASLAHIPIDIIEDITIAVSEVMIALIEHGAGASVAISMTVTDGDFSVRGHTAVEAFDLDDPDLHLCSTVLEGATTAHGIEYVHQQFHIWAAVTNASLQ